MAGRGRGRQQLPKEVQVIFDKYAQNNVRRLKRDDAINLLNQEFHLTVDQATQMFDSFDQDKNGIMSIWEFQQFYETIGKSAQEMLDKFAELDQDNSGYLDVEEAKAGLQAMGLGEKEIDFFTKSSIGKNGQIDIGAFGNLLFRLKVYKEKTKK